MVKIELTENILLEKYIIEEKSIRIVANETGWSTDTIYKKLKEFDLCRDKSSAQKIKCERDGLHNSFNLNEEEVKKLYLDNKLTTYEIGEKLNCSQYKVWKTLSNLGLTRTVSETLMGRTCWTMGKNIKEERPEMCKLISINNKGKVWYWTGKKRSDETKEKLRKANLGLKCSDEKKLNMRLSAIKWINTAISKNHQIFPRYNKTSIMFIENYGKINNLSFQHAENGGEYFISELGYWVDGYDKINNVVIEFDELFHYKQIDKDMKRQNEIIKHLKCRFIRLDENGVEKINVMYYE